MKTYAYKKIDAFASENSSGNPAACLYLEHGLMLSGSQMQKIAKEHKGFVSEVIFLTQISADTCVLKYYSSECEVDFCGHGTIACMYDLIKSNRNRDEIKEFFIETNKGRLTVYNEIQTLDSVFIEAPDPTFKSVNISAKDAAKALGITIDELSCKTPVSLVNAGLNTLIVPVLTLETALSVSPNIQKLKRFLEDHGVDILLLFTCDVQDKNNIVRSRVFAPKFGYLEDPATGSGNSALGYYMLRHGIWDGRPVSIEQNAERMASNIVRLKTLGGKVLFGGGAKVKIEGRYYIRD